MKILMIVFWLLLISCTHHPYNCNNKLGKEKELCEIELYNIKQRLYKQEIFEKLHARR